MNPKERMEELEQRIADVRVRRQRIDENPPRHPADREDWQDARREVNEELDQLTIELDELKAHPGLEHPDGCYALQAPFRDCAGNGHFACAACARKDWSEA